jgi:hypothetical protein
MKRLFLASVCNYLVIVRLLGQPEYGGCDVKPWHWR